MANMFREPSDYQPAPKPGCEARDGELGTRRSTVRVLVCDDQPLVRAHLREMLDQPGEIQVVGEASGGRTAVKLALELNPDVVLMDVSMPDLDGIEATRHILSKAPGIRILAFSADCSSERISKMFRAGARGYLLKPSTPPEIRRAVHRVHAGELFLGIPEGDRPTWPRPD